VTEDLVTKTETEYEAAATLFRALASPVRIAIVDQLLDGGRCVRWPSPSH
jgi:DNA-binding transcriptional ArsR family regulator